MVEQKEPVLHSFITDGLPREHPLAFNTLYCSKCNAMVHHMINECMTEWFEFITPNKSIPVCLDCIIRRLKQTVQRHIDCELIEWAIKDGR